ncbi:MAG: hypothetical protein HC860_04320 [Alkalinema sp. RU_4_3]|nr:hypothetical protein [Alkalinema sp. RU_4_3]
MVGRRCAIDRPWARVSSRMLGKVWPMDWKNWNCSTIGVVALNPVRVR